MTGHFDALGDFGLSLRSGVTDWSSVCQWFSYMCIEVLLPNRAGLLREQNITNIHSFLNAKDNSVVKSIMEAWRYNYNNNKKEL